MFHLLFRKRILTVTTACPTDFVCNARKHLIYGVLGSMASTSHGLSFSATSCNNLNSFIFTDNQTET